MTSDDAGGMRLFATAAAWEQWLAEHHGIVEVVWLCIAKKGSAVKALAYDDALDVALCHGWIDGQRKGHDEHSFLQRFTPRRPNSHWSARNASKVRELQAAGRMQASGLARVAAAKREGLWRSDD